MGNSGDGKKKSKKQNEMSSDSDDSDEMDDWEEVEDALVSDDEEDLDSYKPQLPEQGVQITIDGPQIFNKKRKKKKVNLDEILRQQLNKMKKELQVDIHKTHLLCLIARGFYLNHLTYASAFRALALSHLADFEFNLKKVQLLFVRSIANWFKEHFTLKEERSRYKIDLSQSLIQAFETRVALSVVEYVLMFIILLRTFSSQIQCRLCYALNPLTLKPENLIPSEKQRNRGCSANKNDNDDSDDKKDSLTSPKPSTSSGATTRGRRNKLINGEQEASHKKFIEPTIKEKAKRGRKRKQSSDNEEDYAEEEEKKKKARPKKQAAKKVKANSKKEPQKLISSDDDDVIVEESKVSKYILEYWVEIYVETESKWISYELTHDLFDNPKAIGKLAPEPLLYVVSFDNANVIKDVTQRYSDDYGSCKFRRQRVDDVWWRDTLSYFRPRKPTKMDRKEDDQLSEELTKRPLPTSLSDFKNHPLYVLQKHLLKYEVIYPPDARPVGYFRGEAVYSRDCIKDVHSKDYWMRQARVIAPNQEPYKMSIKRKKYDKTIGDYIHNLPLELYGEWQTQPYIPPVAVDGKVPRNSFGNVELFQPCMIPIGCVHLRLAGLARVANKLKIDCVPAVVGFDQSKAGAHPVVDGFVVCKEFEDTLTAAWEEEQVNAQQRSKEKRQKRALGNWKRLIKGLIIRERLKAKYCSDPDDVIIDDDEDTQEA